MPRRKEPAISNELLDQLLAGGAASAAFGQGGLLNSLKKALTERALNAEMDHHLAGEDSSGNTRNGYGRKTVTTDTGKLTIEVPRDRQSSFDPQLIAKYQRRFPGFDDKIVSMYARGMSTREITAHLHELYGVDVSPDLISTVTDAVLDEVATWQQRPLDPIYPLVFFDAIRVKIRDEGMVRNKAIHIALGVRADGAKEVLGLWLEQNEGAKFWLIHRSRLRATSARSCSVANSVFFEAEIARAHDPPHRDMMRHHAPLRELGGECAQRQIGLGFQPCQYPVTLGCQLARLHAPKRLGRRAARRAQTLRPLDRACHAHPEQLRRFTARPTPITDAATRSRRSLEYAFAIHAGLRPQPAS